MKKEYEKEWTKYDRNMKKNYLNIYILFYGQAQPTIKTKKSANKSTQNQKMNMFKITELKPNQAPKSPSKTPLKNNFKKN